MKNTAPKTTVDRKLRAIAGFIFLFSLASSAFAQMAADDTKDKDKDALQVSTESGKKKKDQEKSGSDAGDILQLSPFTVTTEGDTHRYGPRRSNSAARVQEDYLDMSQQVDSIPKELIEDTASHSLRDAIKFIGGATGGANANNDNFVVRGLSGATSVATIDGFVAPSDINRDLFFFEKIDVIKGPAAILLPTGQAGGAVNYITKSPQDKFHAYVSAEYGSDSPGRFQFEVTGPTANSKIDYLAGVGLVKGSAYWDNSDVNRKLFMAGLTFHLSPDTDLTWKAFGDEITQGTLIGFPVVRGTWQRVPGVPDTFSSSIPGMNWNDKSLFTELMLSSKINRWLSMRLAMDVFTSADPDVEGSNSPYDAFISGFATPPNSLDPNYPAPFYGDTRSVTTIHQYMGLQNDYVAVHEFGNFENILAGGFSVSRDLARLRIRQLANNLSPLDLSNPGVPRHIINPDVSTWPLITNPSEGTIEQLRTYLSERIAYKNKLIVHGTVSYNTNKAVGRNYHISPDSLTVLADSDTGYSTNKPATLYNYGLVYRLTPEISFYYGHEEGISYNNATDPATGKVAPNSTSQQDEVGFRASLLDGRIQTSVGFYDIRQQGQPSINLLTSTYAFLPSSYSKGVDLDLTASVARSPAYSFDMIFSYSHDRARNGNGSWALAVPEDMCRAWATYARKQGFLKQFRFGAGFDYTSARSGDIFNTLGLTEAASPLFAPADNPFRLAPKTTVDAMVSWATKKGDWKVSLNLRNITNLSYYQSATVPFAVMQAPKFNWMASVRRDF